MRASILSALVSVAPVAAAQTANPPVAKAPAAAPAHPREEHTPPEDLEPKDLKPAARQLIDRAKAAHTRRNYDEAAALAEKAIAIDPRAPSAYYILYAVQSIVKRNVEASIRILLAGAQACPDAPSVHYNLGNVYSSRTQHREAADAFRKALTVARTPRPLFMASTNYNLGNELLRSGDKSAAIQAWREALVHNPMHHQARRNIVVTYYEMTAYASAREEARKLQEAGPSGPSGPAGTWAADALRRMQNPIPAGALQPKTR